MLLDVVSRALVGQQLRVVVRPAHSAEVVADRVVGGEDARRRAQLRAHVRDDVAVHRGEVRESVAVVLDDPADAALDAVPAEHLEDDVLRGHPVGQRPGEFDAPDLRHSDVEGVARHRHGDLQSAHADRQHAQSAGGARVGVGTDHRGAGPAEAGLVDGMGDSVAGLGEPQAVALGRRLEEQVVLRVLLIRLEEVVVDVLDGQLCAHAVQSQCFEFEHHHRARGVLGECLIDGQTDLVARLRRPFHQMRADEFLSDVLRHDRLLLAVSSAAAGSDEVRPV